MKTRITDDLANRRASEACGAGRNSEVRWTIVATTIHLDEVLAMKMIEMTLDHRDRAGAQLKQPDIA